MDINVPGLMWIWDRPLYDGWDVRVLNRPSTYLRKRPFPKVKG